MADQIVIANAGGANKDLQELLYASGEDALRALSATFSKSKNAADTNPSDPQNDRTVTIDEFVSSMAKGGLKERDARNLFAQIQMRFGTTIDASKIIPFWQLVSRRQGLEIAEDQETRNGLETILKASRVPGLVALANSFSTERKPQPFAALLSDNDRTITSDEFIAALRESGFSLVNSAKIFCALTSRFGTSLEAEEVLPFWKSLTDQTGLNWIKFADKVPYTLDGQTMATVSIKRTVYPKGLLIPGTKLDRSGNGAWRPGHFLYATAMIDRSKLGNMTGDELAKLLLHGELGQYISQDTTYSRRLDSTEVSCPRLFFQTADIFGPDVYTGFCMQAPPKDTNDEFQKDAQGNIVIRVTSRLTQPDGSVYDLNRLTPVPYNELLAGDIDWIWTIRTTNDRIFFTYSAFTDVPGGWFMEWGTGTRTTADGLVNMGLNHAVETVIGDVLKVGTFYLKINAELEKAGVRLDPDKLASRTAPRYLKGETVEKNLEIFRRDVLPGLLNRQERD